MREGDPTYKDWSAWGKIKLFPDLIPVVGLVTFLRRAYLQHKQSGADLGELSVGWLAKSLISIGTSEWPKPEGWQAILRCQALQARNMGFAFIHSSPLLIPIVTACAGS